MNIGVDELFRNSFVLTVSEDRLRRFYDMLDAVGLRLRPDAHFGRIVDRNSPEYRYNRHFIAAHMSHFEICAKAEKLGLPFVCVFEDDAVPCLDVAKKLGRYLKDIPEDALMCRLGYVPFTAPFAYDGTSRLVEKVTCPKYASKFLSGSHAYVVFREFYQHSRLMYEGFAKNFLPTKDTREIHNWAHYTFEQLKDMWFYEWMMNPKIYRNPLQDRVYTVNLGECLFSQRGLIDWNPATEACLDARFK